MKGTSIESHVYPTLAYGNLSLLTTSMWEPIKMNSYLNVMLTESLYVSDVNGWQVNKYLFKSLMSSAS